MKRRNNLAFGGILIVLLIGVLAGLTWGNYSYARQNPGGNDFLVHWMGTRALIRDGISPYSDETALRIQNFAYGRPAQPGEHELRVAYPLYSIVLFVPFALIEDFTLARAFWMTLLEVGLVMLVFLGLSLTRWKPGPVMIAALVLFSIFWYHGLRPLINGNAVIVVAVLITGALLALKDGHEELAGVLLAFATIKPQVAVVLLLFVFLWGMVNRRYRLVGWLLGTVFLLATSAALLIPDWIVQNLREVIRYPSYNPPGTPGAAFASFWPAFGQRLGLALTVAMVVVLGLEWWRARHAEGNHFLWTACLTLTAAQWIGIQTDPGNFVVLFPALILIFSLLAERARSAGVVAIYVCMGGLGLGLWWLFIATLQRGDQPVQSPWMFFPLPAFVFLLLAWVRWWAVRPARLWIEQIGM